MQPDAGLAVQPGRSRSEAEAIAVGAGFGCLKRDEIGINRHRALGYCLRMISAQTRSAFVARENRFALCANAALWVRIML
jgi:hypothetical protein